MFMGSWVDDEFRGCKFPDVRLEKRLRKLAESLSEGLGEPIPLACQDWACTKAAYRFLDNPRVDESVILRGHFEATRLRFAASSGRVFVLHDTTELSYKRLHPERIGKTNKVLTGKIKDGRRQAYTVCGLLAHSSMVVSAEGLPLGLAAAKFWTRKKFKGANALKKKINPTRVPIEQKESVRWIDNLKQSTRLLADPKRCVHIGDRESDIYELFCAAREAGTHFLVRTCVDRLAEDGSVTISDEMKKVRDAGTHCVTVQDRSGKSCTAKLRVRFRRVKVLPPIGKQKRYPALTLTVVHAWEDGEPKNRERIDWKLLTDIPVRNLRDAVEKLDWYAMRWKIETFHKILKSGCKAEESKLRTAERLINLLAIYCILSWRIFWLCMLNRANPDAPASFAFTETELTILDHVFVKPRSTAPVSHYLTAVARLGGYLNRKSDPPPGNMVMWRGFARLTDIHLGFVLGAEVVGN
jgi:Transposase DNA-binding